MLKLLGTKKIELYFRNELLLNHFFIDKNLQNLVFFFLQTLDIVAENPDKFRVVALAAGSNVTLLADQVNWRHVVIYSNYSLYNPLFRPPEIKCMLKSVIVI